MTQLSKERLEALANIESLECMMLPASHAESAEMARRLLAVEGQEPFGYYSAEVPTILEQQKHAAITSEPAGAYQFPLYAAPQPAPVAQPVQVPDDADPRDAFEKVFPIPAHVSRCGKGYAVHEYNAWSAHDYVKKWDGWNACRAAMLQPSSGTLQLPMQPLLIDGHGTLRFKENQIVSKLLDYATERGYGLNEIGRERFDVEDQMQLAQLIGYSLSGYGTLSYVTDESYYRAVAAAPQEPTK